MSEEGVYSAFVDWCRNAGLHLPNTAALLPAIKARYSLEDAAFLTGFTLASTVLAELAKM